MKKVLLFLTSLILCGVPLKAQLPPAANSTFYGIGAALQSGMTSGWFVVGIPVKTKYSFTTHEVSDIGGKLVSTTRTGIAMELLKLGPVNWAGFLEGGLATSGLNTSGSGSGGLLGSIAIPKTRFSILVIGRVVKSPVVRGYPHAFEFGLGYR